MLIDPHIGNS